MADLSQLYPKPSLKEQYYAQKPVYSPFASLMRSVPNLEQNFKEVMGRVPMGGKIAEMLTAPVDPLAMATFGGQKATGWKAGTTGRISSIEPMAVSSRLPEWQGKAYRSETGYTHGRETTAADVTRYEQEELGNKLGISKEVVAELENRPATDVVWVTKTKRAASRYGTPIEHDLPVGSKILAEDGDGGYLILKQASYPPGAFSNLADKMPRFEISDKGFKAKTLLETAESRFKQGLPKEVDAPYTLGEVVEHPKLFKEYPDLKDVKVRYSSTIEGAAFDPSTNTITVKSSFGKEDYPHMLHEIQHAVQEKEGFARGGSPEEFYKLHSRFNELSSEIKSIEDKISNEIKRYQTKWGSSFERYNVKEDTKLNEYITAQRDKINTIQAKLKVEGLLENMRNVEPGDQYKRLAGEIEARDVSARMGLTPEQRMRTGPYTSEDIPLKDWITRMR